MEVIMGEVLNFPNNLVANRENATIRKFIESMSRKVGLTDVEADVVYCNYQQLHDALTDKFQTPVQLSSQLSLNHTQLNAIEEALRDHITDLHAYSVSVAVGLLIREQVNQRS